VTADPDFAALPERGRQLIDDAYRYGMLTADTARRLRWPDLSPDAARKMLTRAAEVGWLARHPLADQEPYFVLGGRAAAALGVRRSAAPLGPQALVEHYGVLLACAGRRSDVFTEAEFRSRFPELSQPGYSAKNFFPDSAAGPVRLGLFVIDHDKLSSRLVAKVRSRVGGLFATDRPVLRQLVLDARLAVHVVTATEGKRANLAAAFARKQRPLGVPVLVEAQPGLDAFFLVKRR
jgi:hypothetical protein